MAIGNRTNHSSVYHYPIITAYQQQYRGIVQYYLMAQNVSWLAKLHWVMSTSLLKTLAAKHRTSVNKMAHRLQAEIETEGQRLKCLELRVERPNKPPLIARFGGCAVERLCVSLPQGASTGRNVLGTLHDTWRGNPKGKRASWESG
jgi:hypothetical protein